MKLRKRFSALLFAVVFAVGALLLGAAPAAASAQNIHITATANVNLRSGPGTQYAVVGKLPPGVSPGYECYSRGETVSGADGSTNVWFKVRYNGAEGYYSAYFDNVPLVAQSDLAGNYGIGDCSSSLSQADLNQDLQNGSLYTGAAIGYDGNAAASFALKYAQSPEPPQFAGCTWFASNALWAGGLQPTAEWNGQGLRGVVRKVPGTVAATAAPELYTYLTQHGLATSLDITPNLSSNSVPDARPGDLIAYQWYKNADPMDKKFYPDHFAVVVDIAPNGYPEVSEWGTETLPDTTVNYQKRGWTWSANQNEWLQQEYGTVQVRLLSIGR